MISIYEVSIVLYFLKLLTVTYTKKNTLRLNRSLVDCTFRLCRSETGSGVEIAVVSLVGTDPFTSTLFILTFESSSPGNVDNLFVKHDSSKCTEHSEAYLLGSWKSWRCLWTNFTHFLLKTGSDGNWCIVIPGL